MAVIKSTTDKKVEQHNFEQGSKTKIVWKNNYKLLIETIREQSLLGTGKKTQTRNY